MTTYDKIIKKQPKGTRYCVPCKEYVKPMKLGFMKVCPQCERGPLLMTPGEAASEERET